MPFGKIAAWISFRWSKLPSERQWTWLPRSRLMLNGEQYDSMLFIFCCRSRMHCYSRAKAYVRRRLHSMDLENEAKR